MESFDRRIGKIMVEMDTFEGLLEEIRNKLAGIND
jgi:hypothetical protein